MKLYIVRHGQSVANAEGIVAGSRDDSPLTDQGEQNALVAAGKLKRAGITAILASPMKRTTGTALIIREALDLDVEIEIHPEFIELDIGDATGWPADKYSAAEQTHAKIPHAEDWEDFHTRVSNGLHKLKSRNDTILLATHNGTSRMIECILAGRPFTDYGHIDGLTNGEVREIEL